MLVKIAAAIAAEGGRAYYVGGYVRDRLLQRVPTLGEDIDIEVHSLSQAKLQAILSYYGQTKVVGKSFPVLKISGHPEWDFTLPLDPGISRSEACGRRDFTINAMMMDVLSGEVLDFYGGQADLGNRIIRHTRPDVFRQDPLRAYRALQLSARFAFAIHPATLALIRSTDLSTVNRERIFAELQKLLLLSAHPSIGLHYMHTTGVLERVHPLLYALTSCPQPAASHPEGDVWTHTLMVVDQAASLKIHSFYPAALMLAALLHDIGKPATTVVTGQQITTHGHDVAGARLARQFLQEICHHQRLIEAVVTLVKEHMQPILLYKVRDRVTDKAIRKLVNRVNLQELLLIAAADYQGRGKPRDFETIRTWLLARVDSLGLQPGQKIVPLVRGRDLIQIGMIPGPAFAAVLACALEMQLDGMSKDQILQAIKKST